MFCGLTSRWTSPASCAASSADAIAPTTRSASRPLSRSRAMSSARLGPSTRRIAMNISPFGLARLVDGDDVRVVERGGVAALAAEALAETCGCRRACSTGPSAPPGGRATSASPCRRRPSRRRRPRTRCGSPRGCRRTAAWLQSRRQRVLSTGRPRAVTGAPAEARRGGATGGARAAERSAGPIGRRGERAVAAAAAQRPSSPLGSLGKRRELADRAERARRSRRRERADDDLAGRLRRLALRTAARRAGTRARTRRRPSRTARTSSRPTWRAGCDAVRHYEPSELAVVVQPTRRGP